MIFEFLQQAEKVYFKPGKLDEKDKEIIMSITDGDNFTKIISDIYFAILKSGHKNKDTLNQIERFYNQLKNYDKNVFPIKGLDLNGTKDVWGLISSLSNREKILLNIKKLPSIAIRNLKNDIRQERGAKELSDYEHYLSYFIAQYSMLNNRDEKMREAIHRKMFRANTNIRSLVNFADEKENLLGGEEYTKNKVRKIVNGYNSESQIIYSKGDIMVVEVWGPSGLSQIGCNSLWCFSYGGGNNWETFNKHSTNGIVYVIIDFSKKPDSLDFMHVLIKQVDWDVEDEFEEDGNYDDESELFSMDNEPVLNTKSYLIDFVGSEEKAKKIFNFGEEYISPREKKRQQEEEKKQTRESLEQVRNNGRNIFDEFYGSPDKPIPEFKEFYNKYLEHFPENELVSENKVKEILLLVFKKMTTNPNQMSLFEIELRKKIRNIIINF